MTFLFGFSEILNYGYSQFLKTDIDLLGDFNLVTIDQPTIIIVIHVSIVPNYVESINLLI